MPSGVDGVLMWSVTKIQLPSHTQKNTRLTMRSRYIEFNVIAKSINSRNEGVSVWVAASCCKEGGGPPCSSAWWCPAVKLHIKSFHFLVLINSVSRKMPKLTEEDFIRISDHSTFVYQSTKPGTCTEDLQCVDKRAPFWCDHDVRNEKIYQSQNIVVWV